VDGGVTRNEGMFPDAEGLTGVLKYSRRVSWISLLIVMLFAVSLFDYMLSL
jgi:hypothetical protein